ncbi:hypothetical protein C0U44_32400, partial [Klebsiella pneumoniae]
PNVIGESDAAADKLMKNKRQQARSFLHALIAEADKSPNVIGESDAAADKLMKNKRQQARSFLHALIAE